MSLVLRGRTAFAILVALLLAGGAVLTSALEQPGVARASGSSPYAASSILGSIKWNEESKHRLGEHTAPAGSDIWNTTWTSDGNLVGAWGDGEGLTGTSEAQIGDAKLEGTPTPSTSITGTDLYFGAAKARICEEKPTKIDGKPHGIIGLPGEVLYMFHSSENLQKCEEEAKKETVHPSFLAKSTNNGKTWTNEVGGLKWPDANGFSPETILQYGKAAAGALTKESGSVGYLYIYGLNKNTAGTGKVYLARVPDSPTTEIESLSHWQFYEGLTEKSVPKWGETSKNAAVVLQDSNGGNGIAVSFDKAIGRYLVYDTHFDVCSEKQCEPERAVSLFDGPTPWGPWTTFDYENQFDNSGCGTNCLGNEEAVSLELLPKWMSASGLSVWANYSSTGVWDSLNLVEGTISLASSGSSVDNIEVQPVGTATAGTPAVTGHLTTTATTPESKAYIDRPYRLTTIPAAYSGLEQIRLSNSDKSASKTSKYLTFSVTKKENVCVGWDNREAAPEWLAEKNGWKKQAAENNLVSEETGFPTATFNVYKKEFEANSTVTLNGAGTENDQYVVFVGC
ncbi:MAG: DUF4185 domain-containing protein [Actinobacteria bacterium]|nr:DUF4185 domain-containing protein [Actinomycetota bacterium]